MENNIITPLSNNHLSLKKSNVSQIVPPGLIIRDVKNRLVESWDIIAGLADFDIIESGSTTIVELRLTAHGEKCLDALNRMFVWNIAAQQPDYPATLKFWMVRLQVAINTWKYESSGVEEAAASLTDPYFSSFVQAVMMEKLRR